LAHHIQLEQHCLAEQEQHLESLEHFLDAKEAAQECFLESLEHFLDEHEAAQEHFQHAQELFDLTCYHSSHTW
jgi:hypothetical protein